MPAPPLQVVSFMSDVNPFTAQALLAQCSQVAHSGTPECWLLLSTPGGNVREGMAIYNTLRALPFKLTTYNVGNVDSIGNVIFLAGEERYASANATFMFHGVGFTVQSGPVRFEQKDVKERLDSILADNRRIADVIVHRAHFPNRRKVENLFNQASTKSADFAKSVGIIHDIRDVQIPAGTPVHQLVFQR